MSAEGLGQQALQKASSCITSGVISSYEFVKIRHP